MGKGGRVACIFTPFALTLASLICIILVFLGGTNKSSSTLEKFFFFKADLTNFTSSATSTDNTILSAALATANSTDNLKQYYAIYLWNYCADNGNAGLTNEYTYCSAHESSFWFDPITVWGLNGSSIDDLFPTELKNGLKAYETASHWMFIAYVCALTATILELTIGLFAICSRWGSFFTTLVSGLSTLFTIAASLTATILFSTLVATFNTALKSYGIHASLGRSLFVTTWLAVAFSIASGFFWFLSVCCCSGRSPYHKDAHRERRYGAYGDETTFGAGRFWGEGNGRKGISVEKTPYTYERVNSPTHLGAPAQAQHNIPATSSSSAAAGTAGPVSPIRHSGEAAAYYGNGGTGAVDHSQHPAYQPIGNGYGNTNTNANGTYPMHNMQRASHSKHVAFEPLRQQ